MLCRKVHPERNNEIHFTAHSEQDGKFRQSTNDGSDTGERNDIISTASVLFAGNKEQWIKTDTDCKCCVTESLKSIKLRIFPAPSL